MALQGWLSAFALFLCTTSTTSTVRIVHAETVHLALLNPPYTESIWLAVEAAAQLAVHHVNTRNFSIAGPGLQGMTADVLELNLLTYESSFAGTEGRGRQAALDMFDAQERGKVSAVLGPFTSHEALHSAPVSTVLKLPVMGFTQSSTLLSDQIEYPFFMRTCPSSKADAQAEVSVIQSFGWSRFAFLYMEDEYGMDLRDALKKEADASGITMGDFGYDYGDGRNMQQAVDKLAGSTYKIVLLGSYGDDVLQLIPMAERADLLGNDYVWMTAQADVSTLLNETVTGQDTAERLRQRMQGFLWLQNAILDPDLSPSASLERLSQSIHETPVETYGSPSLVGRWPTTRPSVTGWAAFAYDAVWTVAHGISRALDDFPGQAGSSEFRLGVLRHMMSADFVGVSGNVKFLDSGDRDVSGLGYSVQHLDLQGSSPRWVPNFRFFDKAPSYYALIGTGTESSAETLLNPVTWADGDTAVPLGDTQCPQGLIFDSEENRCIYHVVYAAAFTSTISMRNVLTAQVAAHHVNTRNATVVPEAADLPEGFKIKLSLLDTRFSPAGGVEAGLSAYSSGAIGVVGAARSSACVPLSHVLLASKTPVVSFACTAASLSSQETFPYFARTIPTDSEASKLLARTMLLGFNWRRIGVLYHDDEYGAGLFQGFQNAARSVADDNGINAAADLQVRGAPLAPGVIRNSLQEMKDSGYRVFLLIILDYEDLFLEVAEELEMLGKGYTYITAEAGFRWDRIEDEDLQDRATTMMQGFLRIQSDPIVQPQYSNLVSSLAATPSSDLDPYLKGKLLDAGLEPDQWIAESTGPRLFQYAVHTYDAVWALILALAKAESSVPGWMSETCDKHVNCHGDELIHLIRSQTFSGASGEVKFNSEESDSGEQLYSANRDASGMRSPIKFWNSTSKLWQEAGQYVDGPDGGELQLGYPILWPGGTFQTPEDGSACPASMYYNSSTTNCEFCGVGRFTSVNGQTVCKLCSEGQFCGRRNCTSCDSCSVNQYQDKKGQDSCNMCPANTISETRGSVALEDCKCKEGYYRRDGKPGRECFACPSGGVCLGGAFAPYAANGYWGDWSLVDVGVEDSEAASKAIQNIVFHECSRFSQCATDTCVIEPEVSSDGSEDLISLVSSLADEDNPCRADVRNVCPAGYQGRLCKQCQKNYFTLGDKCLKCLQPYYLFVIGTVLCIIVFWYVINRVVANKYQAVDLMLIFLQNASTVTAFKCNWAPGLVNYPFWALAIVNFDVTFVSPECTWGSWGYGHSLILQFLLPVMVAGIYIFLFFANKFMLKWFLRRTPPADVPPGSLDEFEPVVDGWRATLMQRLGFAISDSEFAIMGDKCLAGGTGFLNVVYHTLTLKALEVLFCQRLPDGSQYLSAGPEFMCWEGMHSIYVALSILALAVYTVGVPLCFYLVLRYGKIHNLFRNERFMTQWGWLYLPYERDFYYWEIVIMLRRGALVAVLVTCQAIPILQIVIGIILVTGLITSHFYARPFISSSLDLLDTLGLVSLMGLLCTGSLFYDTYGRSLFGSQWDTTITAICLLLLFGCIFMVVVVVIQDVKLDEGQNHVVRKLRRLMGLIVLEKVNDIDDDSNIPHTGRKSSNDSSRGSGPELGNGNRRSSLTGALTQIGMLGSPSKPVIDVNAGEEQRKAQALLDALEKEPMELTKTIDGEAVRLWLREMEVKSSEMQTQDADPDDIAETGGSLKNMKTVFARVARAFGGDDGYSESQRDAVLRFWLCNHRTKEVMSDTSPLSYYSTNPFSTFFGEIVKQNPYLLDYLLRLSEEQLTIAKEIFNELRDAQSNFSQKGQLATLIADIDKGPLLAWLLISDWKTIRHFRELLVEIYTANHGEDSMEKDIQPKQPLFLSALDKFLTITVPKPFRLGYVDISDPTDRRNTGAVQSEPSLRMQPSLPHIAEREVHDRTSTILSFSLPGSAENSKESATTVIGLVNADGGTRTNDSAAESQRIPAWPKTNDEKRKQLPGQHQLPGSRLSAAPVAAGPSYRKKRQLKRAKTFAGLNLGQFDQALTRLTNHDTPFASALSELIDHRYQ